MLYVVNEELNALLDKLNQLLEKRIQKILTEKRLCLLGIPGGRSIISVFQALKGFDVDFSRIHFFFVDERVVPLNDEQSNYALAFDNFAEDLIQQRRLPKENLHAIEYALKDPQAIAHEYTNQWAKLNQNFDILIFGAGEDGHIASLFPEDDAEKDIDICIKL